MWLCLCPMSLHPTIPCHPTLSPRTPGCPSAAPGQGWGVGAGGGCGTRVPSVPQFPCGPCYVPAPPWLCPQLCGIPAGHRMGTFAQGAQDKDTKGSLVGATTNWAAPSLCHCRARGHLGDTSVPFGRGEQQGNRGGGARGNLGAPRAPSRAGSALAAGAIYSQHCHVSDVCGRTGGRRGQPRLCLLWAVSRCPHHIRGSGKPCPCPHRGVQQAP